MIASSEPRIQFREAVTFCWFLQSESALRDKKSVSRIHVIVFSLFFFSRQKKKRKNWLPMKILQFFECFFFFWVWSLKKLDSIFGTVVSWGNAQPDDFLFPSKCYFSFTKKQFFYFTFFGSRKHDSRWNQEIINFLWKLKIRVPGVKQIKECNCNF